MFQFLLPIIYLSFISLGLPDSLLGSAWPVMQPGLSVPLSYAGIVSMIISVGTVISSLQSDRLTRRFGTGKVTAVSVLMTAVALFGFSFSSSFWMLCVWAVPYGLGAGSVDASLNNYVALHYKSRHMSWLHCMWGIGAATGPYVMSFALTRNLGWNSGYRIIGIFQIILTAVLFISLPLWKDKNEASVSEEKSSKPLKLREIFKIPGVREVLLCFFCYCGIEQTTGLWASSYLNSYKGIPAEQAAAYASMFFIGITVGRAISGFVTMKFSDAAMVRIGEVIILIGIGITLIPVSGIVTLVGLIIVGLGCAPIYPSVIHSTPEHFGADRSQAIIGVQMAAAYVGTTVMPPVFGLIAQYVSVALLPVYLLVLLILMYLMHEGLNRKTRE